MATKKIDPQAEINKVRQELMALKLDIKAGVQKNTNAHKALKTKLAQLLTERK